MINDGGIWYLSTISIMLWWKRKPASLMAPSGIFRLPVVVARLSNPILWKRLQVHWVFSKSIHLRCSSSFMTMLFTIPPFLCNIHKYSYTNFITKKQKSDGFFLQHHIRGRLWKIFQYWLVLGTEDSSCSFTKFQVWMCFLEFSYCFCWIIHRGVFPDKKTFFVNKIIITAFAFYRWQCSIDFLPLHSPPSETLSQIGKTSAGSKEPESRR